MSHDTITIRPRVAADLPQLASALMAQQPGTRYPFRNPLPIPVEDFLHANDATAAWTAELHGQPVGQVCRTGEARGFPLADQLNTLCARAHRCEVGDLTWVSALFVAREARGRGVGRQLLEAAAQDARSNDQHPCLEVLPVHPAAMKMYLGAGWQVVGSLRPAWLREAAGEAGPDVTVMILAAAP